MSVIGPIERFVSFASVNKFGRPNCFGLVQFGWSLYGEKNLYAGYYQRRRRGSGYIYVKTRHYWPTCGYTPAQEAHRAKFASGVSAWHLLTLEQKQFYNKLKYPTEMSGFNRFMRKFMRDEI